jgi:hypothetical protein
VGPQLLSEKRRPQSAGPDDPRLNLTCLVEPGWKIESAVKRLHRSQSKPPESSARAPEKSKKLTVDEQKESLGRMFYGDIRRREENLEDLVRAEREKEPKSLPLIGVWREFYKDNQEEFKEARVRDVPTRAPRAPPARAGESFKVQEPRKFVTNDEVDRANQQLYYKAVQHKQEYAIQLEDHVLRGAPSPRQQQKLRSAKSEDDHGGEHDESRERPQSAAEREKMMTSATKKKISRLRISQCIDRLHRGPPSPLSSQKYALLQAINSQTKMGSGVIKGKSQKS